MTILYLCSAIIYYFMKSPYFTYIFIILLPLYLYRFKIILFLIIKVQLQLLISLLLFTIINEHYFCLTSYSAITLYSFFFATIPSAFSLFSITILSHFYTSLFFIYLIFCFSRFFSDLSYAYGLNLFLFTLIPVRFGIAFCIWLTFQTQLIVLSNFSLFRVNLSEMLPTF